MRKVSFGWAIFLAVTLLAAGGQAQPAKATKSEKKKPAFQMGTTSFADGHMMSDKYTCQGANISPEIHWKGAPLKTKTFALICEDPDAPTQTWVHWVIYNIPITKDITKPTYELTEGMPKDDVQSNGIMQGSNDFKKIGYDGPCPPKGLPHRYYFELYAVDSVLPVSAGFTKSELMKAMKGHILAQTQIMGLFGNQ